MSHKVINPVDNQVRIKVKDQVNAQAYNKIKPQIRTLFPDTLYLQVRDRVRFQIWDQLWEQSTSLESG